jgi:hypothetical protein
LFEAGYDAAHGRKAHLLGFSEFAQGAWADKYQDGKSGELRRAYAAGQIADAEPAEQVNSGGVKDVADLAGIGKGSGGRSRRIRREYFVLAFGHRI